MEAALSTVPAPHPAKGILANRRIPNTRIALVYGASPHFIGRVLNGWTPPPKRFRAWLADYLDLPEADLFHDSILVAAKAAS